MSRKREDKNKGGGKFEEALKRLESIVGRLEKGDLPLDESLQIFEEGVGLSKHCMKTLEEAEQKVEILLKDKNGKMITRPFEPGESPDE